MAFMTLEDSTGTVECILFPDAYDEFSTVFARDDLLLVEGKLEDQHGALTINVGKLQNAEARASFSLFRKTGGLSA